MNLRTRIARLEQRQGSLRALVYQYGVPTPAGVSDAEILRGLDDATLDRLIADLEVELSDLAQLIAGGQDETS